MDKRSILKGFLIGTWIMTLVVVYSIGTTNQENPVIENNESVIDVITVANRYEQLYAMCEDKYNYAINGSLDKAYEIKGKMELLQEEIYKTVEKYKPITGGELL